LLKLPTFFTFFFLAPLLIANLVIGQSLGQDLYFRERFDVAVARAVSEMRILGNLENFISWFLLCIFETLSGSLLLKFSLLVSSFSAEYCLPLVRVGGLFVAAKGHNPQVCICRSLMEIQQPDPCTEDLESIFSSL
jgi:16S rRNA (guanine527-N7)-methyltransferase